MMLLPSVPLKACPPSRGHVPDINAILETRSTAWSLCSTLVLSQTTAWMTPALAMLSPALPFWLSLISSLCYFPYSTYGQLTICATVKSSITLAGQLRKTNNKCSNIYYDFFLNLLDMTISRMGGVWVQIFNYFFNSYCIQIPGTAPEA